MIVKVREGSLISLLITMITRSPLRSCVWDQGSILHQSAAGVVLCGSDAGIAQAVIMDPLPPTISVSII